MHAEYTVHPTNRFIFYVHTLNGTDIDERPVFYCLPQPLLTPPSMFPSLPSLPPSVQPDGLPSNRALTPDVQFQCRLRDQLG